MKKSLIIAVVLIAVVAVTALKVLDPRLLKKQEQPNIIFILTDDLGYGDLGVLYQNERREEGKPYHKTPNIDKMAEDGMILSRHYVPAPVCAPSRASLLRGISQGNAEIRNNQFDKELPENHTLASVLKEAGYSTAIIGKYGLQGKEGNSPETWPGYPTKRGFDHFFGYVRHVDGHNHYPAHEARERTPRELYSGTTEISSKLKGCYTTDLFTAEAKRWITRQREARPDQPFFLYLAYDTPHAGLQVASTPYPEGGGLNGGVQMIGEEGNFINTVGDTIDTYIHPDYAGKDWPEVHKRFASMVRRIDNAVGDLFVLLKDLDIDENTLVVFSSDNGPHKESYGYGDYNPVLFDSYGEFDGIKRDTWEGGIRTPLIVRWPGNVPAGGKNNTPTQFHDWLPTFADAANLPAPANTDGISLLPLLKGEADSVPSKIYIEYSVHGETPSYEAFDESHKGEKRGEMNVVYVDGYKGVRYNTLSGEDDFRIYDPVKDPGETNNLAGSSRKFDEIQNKMKDRMLRMRHINESAPRPYDSVPVPALSFEGNPAEGLIYKTYRADVSYVPDVNSIPGKPQQKGISNSDLLPESIKDQDVVVYLEGLIKAPEDGKYTFSLAIDGGAVVRLHDILLLDADKGYETGSSKNSVVFLEKGYHPFRMTYKMSPGSTALPEFKWEGPGFAERKTGTGDFYHTEE